MQRYNPSEIEPKWQAVWEDRKVNEVQADPSKRKTYVAGMFPYPSGAGMHAGHAFGYTIVDVLARFYRQQGHNVMNPMGWDTFGLPAENYAIKTGTAPAVVTAQNIANFKKQFKRMGMSIDWSREINTSAPEYYKWTQWVFTKLFERGLAYQKESLQWWCPVDKTVLANEQVEGGHCWRCGSLVEKKSMKQWFFKITEYADSLLEEIPALDWPQKIKTAQTNWIGRSVGAEIEWEVEQTSVAPRSITVFSTRPDTIFGATFLVLAPEHPLAKQLGVGDYVDSVNDYITAAVKKSDIERTNDTKEKTGVFTGSYAINPASGEKVPIWVADYVLGGYGTGAIMAVPAHDERDFAFAEKYKLPIVQVVAPTIVDESNPPVEGKEEISRSTAMSVIKHPTDNTYATLRWTEHDWHTFVLGGAEEGEDIVEAALREIREETGFTDLEYVDRLPIQVNSKFFAAHKDVNRNALTSVLRFQLKSLAQEPTHLEAHEKFTLEWVPEERLPELKGVSELGHIMRWMGGESILHIGEGLLINSGTFDGMSTSDAREEIVAWLEERQRGRATTTYKMRDWLISRQRYWGAPIPIIHCEDHGAVAVPEDQLPVVLPDIEDYAPKGDGKSALARATDWVNTTCPECGKPALRETDTMDGYACSSWYLLRYADPHNTERAWDPETVNYWNPLDFYVGGDHAVAHLLYVRFWTHVFKDMGLVDFTEPVKKLVYHGYINAEDGTKMSKSKGNVVDPLDVIEQGYGADALRTYVLFMGPIELDAAWSSKGIAGIYRFLNRVWTLSQEFLTAEDRSFEGNDAAVTVARHKTVRKVTDDIRRLSFNTAIAGLMEYVNDLYKLKVDGFSETVWRDALVSLVQLIAPFAPHMADELWRQFGQEGLVQEANWPTWDDTLIVEDVMTIAVQVQGKLRGEISVAKDTDADEIKKLALAHDNVAKFVGEKEPTKVIYVPGRLVNIVV
jgi:leucyl-tRNA synthetase